MFFIGMPFFYTDNWIFQLKILGIIVATVNLLLFCSATFRSWESIGPKQDAPGIAKLVALTSFAVWIAVVILGRYIPLGAPN
jgi:hypothetical protein